MKINLKKEIFQNHCFRLNYLKGMLNSIEIMHPNALIPYNNKALSSAIENTNKKYNLGFGSRYISKAKRGSFQQEDQNELVFKKYLDIISNIYKWGQRFDIDYLMKSNNIYDYNKLVDLIKKIKEIDFINTNDLYIDSRYFNEICTSDENINKDFKNDIIYIIEHIKKIRKKAKNNTFIDLYLKRIMFDSGYTIGRYIDISDNIIENDENDIVSKYLLYYEKFFNSIELRELLKEGEKSNTKIEKIFRKNNSTFLSKVDIMTETGLSDITIKRGLIKLQKDRKIKKFYAKKNAKYKYIGG